MFELKHIVGKDFQDRLIYTNRKYGLMYEETEIRIYMKNCLYG